MMTLKQRKQLVYAASVLMGLLAVGVLAWGVLVPPEVLVAEGDARGSAGGVVAEGDGNAEAMARGPAMADLLRVASVDWRRPLFDPPAPPAVTRPRVVQAPVELVGTLSEAGHSMAVLKTRDGRTEICGVGEVFDANGVRVEVKSVSGQRVEVEAGGRLFVLVLPETGGLR